MQLSYMIELFPIFVLTFLFLYQLQNWCLCIYSTYHLGLSTFQVPNSHERGIAQRKFRKLPTEPFILLFWGWRRYLLN